MEGSKVVKEKEEKKISGRLKSSEREGGEED